LSETDVILPLVILSEADVILPLVILSEAKDLVESRCDVTA